MAEKLLGPYKFIDKYHYSYQYLDPSAKQEYISLEDAKSSFESVKKISMNWIPVLKGTI